jgi:hypothetical protein
MELLTTKILLFLNYLYCKILTDRLVIASEITFLNNDVDKV